MALDQNFGEGDATLRVIGGESKVFELVSSFYEVMSSDARYRDIWRLHTNEKAQAIDRLARFLIGWMGGPRRYSERYGQLSIPGAHAHIAIEQREAQLWLACMSDALEQAEVEVELKVYLLEQLGHPAQRIVDMAAKT